MALGVTLCWRVRAGGNVLNGGGFDPALASAGTNYADQDAPQLSLTDFATSGAGVTTLTSTTGGFTAAMIGNVIRIASGTNFQAGYYMVTARADTNTVTLDRTPTSGGAGASGVGRLGGAFAGLVNLMGTGNEGLTTPTLTSPLAAGHAIYMRGAGSDDPTSVDYDLSAGYWTGIVDGSATAGRVRVIGYNGRPLIGTRGLLFNGIRYWSFEGLKFKQTAATYAFGLFAYPGNNLLIKNVYYDAGGLDNNLQILGVGSVMIDCKVDNTGGGAAGTSAAIIANNVTAKVIGCSIRRVRGDGVNLQGDTGCTLLGCLVDAVGRDGLVLASSQLWGYLVMQNTFNACGRYGVNVSTNVAAGVDPFFSTVFQNNIISNSVSTAINFTDGTAALRDRYPTFLIDYNDLYANGGVSTALTTGAHDLGLNPTYTASGASPPDFRISTALAGKGWPQADMPGTATGCRSYVDMGAFERDTGSATGAGGGVSRGRLVNTGG